MAPPIPELEIVEEDSPLPFKLENKEETNEKDDLIAETESNKEDFSLGSFWIQYAEEAFKAGKKSASSTMKVVTPILNENIILLEVKNEQQKEAIETIRIDFLSAIRKKGMPSGINFEFLVNPDKNENLRPYTDKEKIDYLSSKNVLLQKLIKDLNLKV